MELDYSKITAHQRHDKHVCLSIDQIISSLDNYSEGKHVAETLRSNTKSIIRDALKLFVPNLEDLESQSPDTLNTKIYEAIERKLQTLDKKDLHKIASAIGLDPQRYENHEKFIGALASQIRDSLNNPDDLAKALNILSAGNLLEKLGGGLGSSLIKKLKELMSLCEAALDLLITLSSNRGIPVPHSKPIDIPTLCSIVGRQLYIDDKQRVWIIKEDETVSQNKGSSILDALSKSCYEFGEAAQKEKKENEKIRELEEASNERQQNALQEFLSDNPDLKEELKLIAGDPNFRDGPITGNQKYQAISFAKKVAKDKQKIH